MGHKDLRTTQIYAKITNERVSRDMDMVVHKFDRFTEMTMSI